MSKKKTIEDAEKAALAQDHQLKSAQEALDQSMEHVTRIAHSQDEAAETLDTISSQIDSIAQHQGVDISKRTDECSDTEPERLKVGRSALARLRAERKVERMDFDHIDSIQSIDEWDAYISAVDEYAETHALDLTADPYTQVLGETEHQRLREEYCAKYGDLTWCAGDYAVVGLASIVAVLIDYFIVSVPPVNSTDGVKDATFKEENQGGSPVTRFLFEQKNKVVSDGPKSPIFATLNKWQKDLEAYAKVPYDIPTNKHPDMNRHDIPGFAPNYHRLRTPGHDPLLGAIVGIRDILKGEMTVIDKTGGIQHIDNVRVGAESNPLVALVKWVAHLVSDIPTTRGIQVPGMSAFLCIKAESPFSLKEGGPKVSFNNLIQFMYKNGYTVEHFITMSIVPMIVELIITIYHNVANFGSIFHKAEYDKKEDFKLKSMLAAGHTVTMGGNVGKMALMNWNPTAFNYAQCIRTVSSYFALAKAKRLRDEKINKELYEGWQELRV